MPRGIRWLTITRQAITPLVLKTSIQSLSSTFARLASSSEIHTCGPPRLSDSIRRLSEYVLWMPHFWCGVRKLSAISGFPLGRAPNMLAVDLVSMAGLYTQKPSPKSSIQR